MQCRFYFINNILIYTDKKSYSSFINIRITAFKTKNFFRISDSKNNKNDIAVKVFNLFLEKFGFFFLKLKLSLNNLLSNELFK